MLLPVRDAVSTLGVCLASLAAQTLSDHQVIAVDDGSLDDTLGVLETAARRDPRVRVIRLSRRGLPFALNAALHAAEAPLLARMDADDWAHPDRLAIQAEGLARNRAIDILGCRVRLVSRGPMANAGMRAYVRWLNELLDHETIVRDLWVESPLVHPSVMMRAPALRALGGYRDFDGPEDYDLWFRAHHCGLRFGKTPETLLDWSDHADRLTRTDPRYRPERFLALKIDALERTLLAVDRPVVVWGSGPVGKAWSKALRARGHRVAAFVEVDPRKIGRTIHSARVVALDRATAFSEALHLAAVGQPGARQRIREAARAMGLQEGRDLVAVA